RYGQCGNLFMLRSLIISPDRVLAAQLHAAIVQVGSAAVVRIIDRYPTDIELSRIVRAHAPQVVFVSTDSVDQVVAVAGQLEQILPGVQVIAAGQPLSTETLMVMM